MFEQEPVDPNNPLLKMDNVAVTNHYASYSEVAWERANTQLGEEAVRIADGYWPMFPDQPRRQTPLAQHVRDPISWEVMMAEIVEIQYWMRVMSFERLGDDRMAHGRWPPVSLSH